MAASGRERTDSAARMAAGISDIVAGKSYAWIARKHGVSRRQVRRWAEHPEVREAIESAKTEALEQLQLSAFRASAALNKLLASKDERIRQTTAMTILDRIGVVKSEHHQVEDVTPLKDVGEARIKLLEICKALGLKVVADEPDEEGGEDE
jgi:hypothetical protein